MREEYRALSKLVGRNFAVLDDGRGVYLTPAGEVRTTEGKLILPAHPGRARLFERNKEAESGTGTGLPSDVGPYKQMATDGSGNWVAADRLAYSDSHSVDWNGNTDGLISVSVPGQNTTYYKVSSVIPSNEDIKKSTVTVFVMEDGEGAHSYPVSEIWAEMEAAGMISEEFVMLSDQSAIIVREDNYSLMGAMLFPEAGVYFVNDGAYYTQQMKWGTVKTVPVELIEHIVITRENDKYTCNVPYDDFNETVMRGVNIVLIDKDNKQVAMDSYVQVGNGDPIIRSSDIGWRLNYTAAGITSAPQ